MYCQKCGSELREDALFCETCGTKIEQAVRTRENLKNKMDTKKIHFKKMKLPSMVSIAVIILIALVSLLGGRKKININDYLIVSFNGYDTVGTASVEFDYYSFLEDYGEKLKYKSSAMEKEIGLTACKAVERYLKGELSKSEELINGDMVKYYWTDLELTKMPEFNYELILETYETKVDGLKELREVDLFEGVEVTFSGYAPYLRAELNNNSTDELLSQLSYSISKGSDIDNGDVLTITLYGFEDISEKEFQELKKALATEGVKTNTYQKNITVEGCSEYIRTLEGIPEGLLEDLKTQAEAAIYSMEDEWDNNVTIENVTYCGSYFFWYGSSLENGIYLIHKVTVRENFPDLGVDNQFDFYYPSYALNMVSLTDGTYSSSELQSNINAFFDRKIADRMTLRYRRSYVNFQSLYIDLLADNVANFTYYTDINIEEQE